MKRITRKKRIKTMQKRLTLKLGWKKKILFIALGPPHTHRSQRVFFFNFLISYTLRN